MNPHDCPACGGAGEVPELRLTWCCSGRNAWGEVVCSCGGLRYPEAFYVPCPDGCGVEPVPAPPEPCDLLYAW